MTVWSRTATGELHTWEEVSSSLPERNLLLGNGASRAIWADFKYESLLRRACAAIPHPLTPKQQRVFRALQTENFEAVLTALGDAKRVARALDLDGRPIADAYIATRDALITAVSGAHVPWGDALAAPLRRTKAEFSNHSKIFTTNYDLLSYWAVMVDGPPAEFGDYFVRGAFQRDQYKGPKKLLFLHGGIHLVRTRAGEVKKRAAPAGQNLLDTFPAAFNDGSVPLFVSEGKSADKLGAIRRSEYLSFALEQLREAQEPLVVFGHSLDAQFDQHVVDAINQSPTRLVAVSIRRASKQRVEQQQHDLLSRINKQMSFFDAATHPLGDDHMKVTPTT